MIKRVLLLLLAFSAIFFVASNSTKAAVNDFYFESFVADYYLTKDTQNRSQLKVIENLVAVFPNLDQNHGIERAIPDTYDGHPVDLKIISVTNANGDNLNFKSYSTNGNTVLRIGDADKFVQGRQSYVLTYQLSDVTKNFDNGDEFYWDTNGNEWQQTFNNLNATLHIDSALVDAFDGRYACFSGNAGQNTNQCTIKLAEAPNEKLIVAESINYLAPGENISIIAGFKAGTFEPYTAPPLTIWQVLLFLIIGLLAIFWYIIMPIWLFIWGLKKWRAAGRDKKQNSTIVPQYLPPKDVSILVSDVVIKTSMSTKALSASIINMAVSHFIKIYQNKKDNYELEIIKDPTNLNADDLAVLQIVFENNVIVGNRTDLTSKNKLYSKVEDLKKDIYQKAIILGYMVDTRKVQKGMFIVGGILLFLSFLSVNIFGVIASITTLTFAGYMPARTNKGVDLKTYLDGTKMYMQVAEEERFKAMQGSNTAQRVDINDQTQLIKLYEKLLPLAILYGIEESWVKEFAHLYKDTNPDWFVSNNAFSAAVLASSINNFGSYTSANTFSPPTSSSSSGFSSGGGFSGGGGGGGGGGGW